MIPVGKPKKDGQRFNIIMDRNQYNRLSLYAEEKGQTKTLAVERIIKKFLDDEGVPAVVETSHEE